MPANDIYLGDGVYASFDGYHIVLDLRAQYATQIALEPSVMKALVEYADRVYGESATQRKDGA